MSFISAIDSYNQYSAFSSITGRAPANGCGTQSEACAKGKVAGSSSSAKPGDQLSQEEVAEVQRLKKIDAEVKAHEMAHMAAGGGIVRGGASFSYTTGPDGRQYATGGEVSIDTSVVANDPRATVQKMQKVQRAALAPANPSGQDQRVAADAAAKAAKAQMELAKQNGLNGEEAENAVNAEKKGFKIYSKDGKVAENLGPSQPSSVDIGKIISLVV